MKNVKDNQLKIYDIINFYKNVSDTFRIVVSRLGCTVSSVAIKQTELNVWHHIKEENTIRKMNQNEQTHRRKNYALYNQNKSITNIKRCFKVFLDLQIYQHKI